MLFNADFVDIIPTDHAVKLFSEDIIELIVNFSDIALWKSKFPEQSWILKGFSLMTLFDATTENAVSSFKSNLLREDTPAQLEEIRDIFRSIYRIDDLRIGLTSFEKIKEDFNLRIVEKQLCSHLLYDSTIAKCEEMLCNETLENMLKTQGLLVVPDIGQCSASTPISIHFKMDEKQFDIDGSYNVRYEIAKKRIDKAKIKGSILMYMKKTSIWIISICCSTKTY